MDIADLVVPPGTKPGSPLQVDQFGNVVASQKGLFTPQSQLELTNTFGPFTLSPTARLIIPFDAVQPPPRTFRADFSTDGAGGLVAGAADEAITCPGVYMFDWGVTLRPVSGTPFVQPVLELWRQNGGLASPVIGPIKWSYLVQWGTISWGGQYMPNSPAPGDVYTLRLGTLNGVGTFQLNPDDRQYFRVERKGG